MPIIKYNPFEIDDFPAGFRTFQDAMNRLAGDTNQVRAWTPAVDVFETENELVLKADVPEVELKDIDIRLENGTLSLKGERKFQSETEDKKKGYHRMERGYGAFARFFTLPDSVDTEHVQADYQNGVLTITLPKKEVAKPRTIKIQVNNSQKDTKPKTVLAK